MKFNENLKYLRKKEKLTQEQLAEKLNVSRQAVTKWESGQALPDISNLKDISILFGITMDELVGDNKNTNATSLEKKLKDLPIFLFLLVLSLLLFISELGINDASIMGIILVLFIPMEVWCIKTYFTGRKITDLTETKEGKKTRNKLIIIKSAILSGSYGIIRLIIYIYRNIKGLEITETIPQLLLMTGIGFVILIIVFSFITKDEVKKFNK